MLYVKDIMNLITKKPALVGENTSLKDIANRMIEDPKTKTIYVVGNEGRLLGIITIDSLLIYLYRNYIPAQYMDFKLPIAFDGKPVAQDIMREPIYVRGEDTLKTAFEKMFLYRIWELPVVDGEGKVIGDLDSTELVAVWEKLNL